MGGFLRKTNNCVRTSPKSCNCNKKTKKHVVLYKKTKIQGFRDLSWLRLAQMLSCLAVEQDFEDFLAKSLVILRKTNENQFQAIGIIGFPQGNTAFSSKSNGFVKENQCFLALGTDFH